MARSQFFRLGSSLVLAVFSLSALVVSFWPLQTRTYEASLASLINRPGSLVMELPAEVRFRDTGEVKATFTFDPGQEPENMLLEVRLDVPGLSVSPQPTYIGPIEPGKSQIFDWQILAQQKGKYSGTLWMYLTPADQPEKKQVFLSRQFDLKVLDYAGLPGFLVRWAGAVGLLIALALWFMPTILIKMDKNPKKVNN